MVANFFVSKVWAAPIFWAIVYLADYYLTIYNARLTHAHLAEHIEYEGSLEITPAFQRDVDNLRLFSQAFFLRLLLSLVLIPLVWVLSVVILGQPQFYIFMLGAVILREVPVLLRHIRIIAMAHLSKNSNGIQGKIKYARWFNLRLSSIEVISFAMLFLVMSFFMGSWLFLGGFLGNMVVGISHWLWSIKSYQRAKADGVV